MTRHRCCSTAWRVTCDSLFITRRFFATKMPEFMAKVEKTCVGPWLCGSKCSLADASFFVFIKEFFDDVDKSTAAIAACPKISAAVAAFGKIPERVAWQKARPETMF